MQLVISQTQDVHNGPVAPGAAIGTVKSVLNSKGAVGRPAGEERIDKLAGLIVASPAAPDPRYDKPGYWNPAVVTRPDGKATVTLALPERSTAWVLHAKGITADTLIGEATKELAVRKGLFGELKLPEAFTDGDEPEIGVTVHNDLADRGSLLVTLKTIVGGRAIEAKRTLEVKGRGIYEMAFKTILRRPENVQEAKLAARDCPGSAFGRCPRGGYNLHPKREPDRRENGAVPFGGIRTSRCGIRVDRRGPGRRRPGPACRAALAVRDSGLRGRERIGRIRRDHLGRAAGSDVAGIAPDANLHWPHGRAQPAGSEWGPPA